MSAAPAGAPAGAPVIKFRNYKPTSDALTKSDKVAVVPAAPAPSVVFAKKEKEETARLVAAHQAAATGVAAGPLAQTAGAAADDAAVTIAPKKPNWDLKRDVQERLDALDKQTKRVMAEMVRERVAAEAAAAVVGSGAAASTGAAASASAAGSSAAAADDTALPGSFDAAVFTRTVMAAGDGFGDESGGDDDARGGSSSSSSSAAAGAASKKAGASRYDADEIDLDDI